jgi:hypothetical protein
MQTLDAKWMLLPMAAQVVLTLIIYRVTWVRRTGAVRAGEMDPLYFKTKQVGEPTRHVKAADELLLNLFENPVLFFAGCLATMTLDLVDPILLGLAVIYPLGRILHAKEMLGKNSIRKRFRPWVASLFTLGGFWIWLTISAFL